MTRLGRSRLAGLAVVVAGLWLSTLESIASPNAVPVVLTADLAVGWALIASAGIVAGSPNGARSAVLWAAAGLSWFLGAVVAPLGLLYLGVLAHVLVTDPTGRLTSSGQRAVAAIAYAAAIVSPQVGIVGVEVVVLGLVAAVGVVRAFRGRGRERHGAAVAALATIAIALVFVIASAADASIGDSTARVAASVAIILGSLAVASDLRWGGWSQDAIARLVIDLGDRPGPTTLRDRLAEAMDDPTLVIGYGIDGGTSFVDDAGRPVEGTSAAAGRTIVPLLVAGGDAAVLIRDAGAPADPVLVEGVARAAQLAIRNARLHAETRRQVAELEASRARLIAAADRERLRIRAELDGGALQRLTVVRDRIADTSGLGDQRARLADHASSVIEQLAELSAGLGPATAMADGLQAALRRLAAAAEVPVRVRFEGGPIPPTLEAGIYYVCSEGLANIAKHAQASQAFIHVTMSGDGLSVELSDDGVGGADPEAGSGLRGLRDRIETMGGRLTTVGPAGGGTRLRAELPIARSATDGTVRLP